MLCDDNRRIAHEWRQDASSPYEWRRCANQAGTIQGEAGGYFVEADGFERRAYLKPTNIHADAAQVARAAREKIASDLAYDLGLPVPAAQLTTLSSPPPGCEPTVVVSLVQYPTQHPWALIKAHPLDGGNPLSLALAQVLTTCAPMLAFDTWLDQTDHGDHPHNIVWGYDPQNVADSRVIFLDYAFSMGFRGDWAGGMR